MIPEPISWTEEPTLDPEQERRALLRSLRRRQGFGVLFVRCTPNQVDRLVEQVQQELPQKKTALLTLTEPIDNLFEIVDRRPDKPDLGILFIQGLEKSLEPYIQPGYGGEGDYYKLDTAPRILSHLNQQRENFRENFPQLCFVFLLPRFALKYFLRRAPDFFDWGSGIFEIPTDRDLLLVQELEIYLKADYQKYITWTQAERDREILEIRSVVEELAEDPEAQAGLLFEQGNLFAASQDYQNALASYEQALHYKPDNHQAWYNRGIFLANLERYEEAVASYEQALHYKPDDPEAWNNRGNALFNLGRYEEAVASYDVAVQHKTDLKEAWYNRGIALGNLEHYRGAIASYDESLKHKPDYYDAWFNKGYVLLKLERYEEAIATYDRALEYNLDDHEAWKNRGNALYRLGRYEEAIASFDRALEYKPDDHEAWNNRGNPLSKLERYEEAIASFDKALEIKPDDANVIYGKSCVYGLQSEVEAATSCLKEAISLDPKYREMAKTDADFDAVRGETLFQAMMEETK